MSQRMTKPTKWNMRPFWSESSLCAQWVAKVPRLLYVDTADWADAQADLSLRWAHLPCCWFCHALPHIVIIIMT